VSRSLNKATIIGNLGSDPDVRTVSSGTKVAEFSVATSRQWTGRDGQQQEKTEWHRIVAWGFTPDKDGLAGVAERFLKKGDRVYVEGQIEYRSYDDKDGNTRYITEIRAAELIMLGGAGGGGGSDAPPKRSGSREKAAAGASGASGGSYDDFKDPGPGEDDDLPF
jgi:single-strand DNA-binding protein